MNYGDYESERIKHLEMIQAVIARLSTNSFFVKGATGTIVTGLLGLALTREQPALAYMAAASTLVLWSLDAFFLRTERLFRMLYEGVRTGRPKVDPFFLGATTETFVTAARRAYPNVRVGQLRIMLSKTLIRYFGLIAAVSVAVAIIVGTSSGADSSSTGQSGEQVQTVPVTVTTTSATTP